MYQCMLCCVSAFFISCCRFGFCGHKALAFLCIMCRHGDKVTPLSNEPPEREQQGHVFLSGLFGSSCEGWRPALCTRLLLMDGHFWCLIFRLLCCCYSTLYSNLFTSLLLYLYRSVQEDGEAEQVGGDENVILSNDDSETDSDDGAPNVRMTSSRSFSIKRRLI